MVHVFEKNSDCQLAILFFNKFIILGFLKQQGFCLFWNRFYVKQKYFLGSKFYI